MLANIFMFLPMFVVSSEDTLVPVVATMSKRVGCAVECLPVDFLPAMVRNVLRPKHV